MAIEGGVHIVFSNSLGINLSMRPALMLLFLSVLGCSYSSSQEKMTTRFDSSVAVKANNLSNDTLVVDKIAAVFIEPDSLRIGKRKKEIGEELFYIGSGDYLYYMNVAWEFLDSMQLKILEAKGKTFLKFIYADESQHVIDLDTLPELWNVYFFDPSKKVMQVDMTIIDEEYNKFFK